MGHIQGKLVRIELQNANLSSGGNGPQELGLFDEDGNAVTLQPHERLVLRNLTVSGEAAADDVTIFSDDDDDNTVDDGERLLHVGTDTTGTSEINYDHDFGPEGVAGAIGIVPHVIAGAAGEVVVTGVGYIINGKTPSHRPDWKADDFGQQ